MNVGKLVINVVLLALVILPPLYLIFPRRNVSPGQTLLENYPQFRMFTRDEATTLTMRMLRVSEKWVTRKASTFYIQFAMLLTAVAVFLHLETGANVTLLLAFIVALNLTLVPWLAILAVKSSLKSRYNQEKNVYSRVITKSLILMSAQFRSSLTAETVLMKLPTDMPSGATERFQEDITTFRQMAMSREETDVDTSIGGALVELGTFWDLASVVLIGRLLQTSGLEESDVADQMITQVQLAYAHELTDDAKYYKSREVSMAGIMMLVFLVSAILPLVVLTVGIFSHNSLL